ncbi:MAG: MotA/TolQ/ExbB proton channel family protein [Acidobacteria bacterium]|nr:MotA/TolQ/ExbB proton channel family protein [Acidobacteriota bacterium]
MLLWRKGVFVIWTRPHRVTQVAFFLQEIPKTDVTSLIAQTGPVAKVVLLILLGFSIFSWAVIYTKWRRFKLLRAQEEQFLRAFRKARKLSELNVVIENFPPHPLRAVFEAGYRELFAQVGNPGGPAKNPKALERALQIASSQQLSLLEQNVNWLATTGSVTPFIGLFGTVWGIMDAFLGLGSAGAASLRAVGPGIAEALIATAAGLFAAIPAVIAYNHFLSRIREFGKGMDNFSLEFLNAAERNPS